MFEKKAGTAKELIDAGERPRTPQEALKAKITAALAKGREDGKEYEDVLQSLYQNTILETEALEALTSALLAGNHVLLFGPSGSGKTGLAKEVLRLFPKEIFVVDGCPVQDDPFSLVDAAYHRAHPCCPFCKERFGGKAIGTFDPKTVDPAKVPVVTATIREGHGFARVQGSAEVFPDNLTGTINIRRLEEIGDPMSPLVMEPGKLLQANRGVLIVDEVGKLPLGTQNVLLQALQESVVSPARSRETFPAAFITICTSNIDDLDNINEPLNDRLANSYVGFSMSMAKNRAIVRMNAARSVEGMFVPLVLVDACINLIIDWRRTTGELYDMSEVGSNRTLIDMVTRTGAYASLRGSARAGVADLRRSVRETMLSHVRAKGGDSYVHDKEAIETFIAEHFPDAMKRSGKDYWCRFVDGPLGGNSERAALVMNEGRLVLDKKPGGRNWPDFEAFVKGAEPFQGGKDDRMARTVFSILFKAGTFGGEGPAADDKAAPAVEE